ncbi:UNVERIFIED_CONTAM: hypothetical protein FKN15_059888 [Acipenser sinensis]
MAGSGGRPPRDLDSKACVTIGEKNFEMKADDLEQISELGRGAYGVVDKMRHVPSGLIMAVKRIRATVNSQEQKRLLMDLDISMRTVDCHFTVTFYGALFREGDVWICMELMDTSLDKFYKQVIEKGMAIPEDILGKITVSIVKALEHLHSRLSVIHRDVKPSNVLINTLGQVKMCDFGISGYLVDSVAKTMDAGCKPYMAPERINPELSQKGYSVKSDIWSLGITMRIRATVNSQEQKRLLMDLDISMRTVDCHFTVTFYGALFREGDVWICMELMDTSLDKFYKQVIEKGMAIPEDILGKITVSIVKALEHLHSRLSVIHRDVKPSNVLINTLGQVKMCDFGISGYLVDSVAKTMDAGCKPYMAPERINPELNQKGYSVKSDIWSLGITMFTLSSHDHKFLKTLINTNQRPLTNKPGLPPPKPSSINSQSCTTAENTSAGPE